MNIIHDHVFDLELSPYSRAEERECAARFYSRETDLVTKLEAVIGTEDFNVAACAIRLAGIRLLHSTNRKIEEHAKSSATAKQSKTTVMPQLAFPPASTGDQAATRV